jgi:hypothetical protein
MSQDISYDTTLYRQIVMHELMSQCEIIKSDFEKTIGQNWRLASVYWNLTLTDYYYQAIVWEY